MYLQLKEYVLERIKSGQSNDRLPSISELIKRYHVSLSTINRMLFALEKEGLIERRRGKGIFIAGRDGEIALEQGTGGREILFAYPRYFSHFIFRLTEHVHMAASQFTLRPVELKKDTDYEIISDIIAKSSGIAAVFVLPAQQISIAQLAEFNAAGIPFVFFNEVNAEGLTNIRIVCPDYEASASRALQYLIDSGHTDIAYIGNEPEAEETRIRERTIRRIFSEHGISPDLMDRAHRIRPWDSALLAGYVRTKELITSHRPSAVIYDSASGAAGALRAYAEAGIRVPEDVSIIADGGEGDSDQYAYTVPGITAMAARYDDLARTAFRAVAGGEHITRIASVLCERSSTAAVPVSVP
ncbi:MAG: substrate-binding domain-containing protein [Spirochaetota bacterium]